MQPETFKLEKQWQWKTFISPKFATLHWDGKSWYLDNEELAVLIGGTTRNKEGKTFSFFFFLSKREMVQLSQLEIYWKSDT